MRASAQVSVDWKERHTAPGRSYLLWVLNALVPISFSYKLDKNSELMQ